MLTYIDYVPACAVIIVVQCRWTEHGLEPFLTFTPDLAIYYVCYLGQQ